VTATHRQYLAFVAAYDDANEAEEEEEEEEEEETVEEGGSRRRRSAGVPRLGRRQKRAKK
jgi:hypothetical protein